MTAKSDDMLGKAAREEGTRLGERIVARAWVERPASWDVRIETTLPRCEQWMARGIGLWLLAVECQASKAIGSPTEDQRQAPCAVKTTHSAKQSGLGQLIAEGCETRPRDRVSDL